MTATPILRIELAKRLASNLGTVPVYLPKSIKEIKVLRILIGILRTAEEDYLSSSASQEDASQADQTLFGLHFSPLPRVCRVLGIDHHAARMKLIEWKARGLTGDPVFDYLTKPGAVDQYERGRGSNIPTLREEEEYA